MLDYLAALHERSTYPAEAPLPFPFETPGAGYVGGKCFGHWDAIHAALDALSSGRLDHAVGQLKNLFALQQEDGRLPALVYYRGCTPALPPPEAAGTDFFSFRDCTYPPLWPAAVEACLDAGAEIGLLSAAHAVAVCQLDWFERARRARPAGFCYRDILDRTWESGVDEGVRFDAVQPGAIACVDACAHVWALYDAVVRWGRRLGLPTGAFERKRRTLGEWIRRALWDEETGFFYDHWMMAGTGRKTGAFEGMWPVVMGIADERQAQRVIDEHLLNARRFFTPHPIATVALNDPACEPRMWRGPAWNSMTYWAAAGCLRYGRPDAAHRLSEAALDRSAEVFARTGTIWEFYDAMGGSPEALARKPNTPHKTPCRDYAGHNPLAALAGLWIESRRMACIPASMGGDPSGRARGPSRGASPFH